MALLGAATHAAVRKLGILKNVGKKGNLTSFLLKLSFVALFTLFLLLDHLPDNSLTLDAFVQVLSDPRLMFVCLICLPWSKLERVARRTGRLRLAQSLALATIGILTVASIIILVSSSQAILEHRDMERQLRRDKKLIKELKGKYAGVLTGYDLESEILEREHLIDLFDWVRETIPVGVPWTLVAPNPSTLDLLLYELNNIGSVLEVQSLLYYPLPPGVFDFACPILISSEVHSDEQLKSTLERNLVFPFPSHWSNTMDSPDLLVWIPAADARPSGLFLNVTMARFPLPWCVTEVEDNGNSILDVTASPSCLIIDEESTKTLRTEADELSLLQTLEEKSPSDEQTIEKNTPKVLIGSLLLFLTIPATGYYALKSMRAILNWKTTQRQNWVAFQKKLESLDDGLILEGNRVNGYTWADLEHFVDWNKPVIIRITDTKYGQLLEAIYQSAPLETAFIVQEGASEDKFTKETGRFAVDFSQPLEATNENQLATPSEDKAQMKDVGDI